MDIKRLYVALPALTLILFFASLVPASAVLYESNNHKAVFRYRSFTGSTPSWVSTITSSGNISHTAGIDINVTDRGTGFDNFIATDFDGSTEFVQGSSTVDITDANGRDSFAVEAWFKADSVSGTRTLYSDTQSSRGIALKVISGRLRGIVRFKNGSASVNTHIYMDVAEPNLSTGQWYYAVFHVKENVADDRFELRLYLDGRSVGYLETTDRWEGVYDSAEKPMVGAEPGGGAATGDYFDGEIYAVTVSNHAIYLNNYVKNPLVRDGGRYFGVPSYHDYLDTRAGVDYRIHQTTAAYADVATKVVDRIQMPYLNDLYVPQGLGFNPTENVFYLGMYWRDVDAETGIHPSLIVEINWDGTLRRTYQVKKINGDWSTSHMSGLAYHDGSIYTSFAQSIYRYDLTSAPNPTYIFDPETFANPKGDENPVAGIDQYLIDIQGNVSVSCLQVSQDSNGDDLIWTCDWDTTAYSKLLGYEIDANGDVATTATYAFTLPVTKVQGVACYNATSTYLDFYLSTSYGDNPSKLYSVRFNKGTGTYSNLTTVFTGPAGMEDLTLIGTEVWTTSESGAKCFQRRTDSTPWEDLYPFIFGIEP